MRGRPFFFADMKALDSIWVFHSTKAQFTTGLFTSLESAEAAIREFGLSGILTKYPIDTLVYPWAIENGWFKVRKPEQESAEFIGRFTSASQEHYHYEDGRRE